jgi:hypothetical protein
MQKPPQKHRLKKTFGPKPRDKTSQPPPKNPLKKPPQEEFETLVSISPMRGEIAVFVLPHRHHPAFKMTVPALAELELKRNWRTLNNEGYL